MTSMAKTTAPKNMSDVIHRIKLWSQEHVPLTIKQISQTSVHDAQEYYTVYSSYNRRYVNISRLLSLDTGSNFGRSVSLKALFGTDKTLTAEPKTTDVHASL